MVKSIPPFLSRFEVYSAVVFAECDVNPSCKYLANGARRGERERGKERERTVNVRIDIV